MLPTGNVLTNAACLPRLPRVHYLLKLFHLWNFKSHHLMICLLFLFHTIFLCSFSNLLCLFFDLAGSSFNPTTSYSPASILVSLPPFPTPLGKELPAQSARSLQCQCLLPCLHRQASMTLCLQRSKPRSMPPSALYLPTTTAWKKLSRTLTAGAINNKLL